MANIDRNLEIIRTAIYGKDMRQAIHDSIQELASTYSMATYIRLAFSGVFPEFDLINHIETVTGSSTLLGRTPYYAFPNTYFDPENDGLLVWKNRTTLIPKAYYTFDTESILGFIKIDFSALGEYFNIDDEVLFSVYKKAIRLCTQAEYDAMSTHDANTLYVITG